MRNCRMSTFIFLIVLVILSSNLEVSAADIKYFNAGGKVITKEEYERIAGHSEKKLQIWYDEKGKPTRDPKYLDKRVDRSSIKMVIS